MDEKTGHRTFCMKPGAFGWTELMTTDVEAARRFYGPVFGWKFVKAPMPGLDYDQITVDGLECGGIMKRPPQCAGMPPSWGTYVTVADAGATAAKVVELGGTILVPPTTIPQVGTFLVLQDPQKAVIMAMQYHM